MHATPDGSDLSGMDAGGTAGGGDPTAFAGSGGEPGVKGTGMADNDTHGVRRKMQTSKGFQGAEGKRKKQKRQRWIRRHRDRTP